MNTVNRAKDVLTVALSVSPILKEFIVATNNKSDIITPQKKDFLWMLVKQHLIVDPEGWKPYNTSDNDSKIYIQLLNCRGHKTMTNQRNKSSNAPGRTKSQEMYIDTTFRYTLSKTGEKVIRDFLSKNFKETFHTFMLASLMANKGESSMSIIRRFLVSFDIPEDFITIDMLKKTWQRSMKSAWHRSRQKQFLDYGDMYCAAVH